MTELLQKAFTEASRLPPSEQDAIAGWLIHELESERRWHELFARSPEKLAELAAEALAEHRAGQTRPLELDEL